MERGVVGEAAQLSVTQGQNTMQFGGNNERGGAKPKIVELERRNGGVDFGLWAHSAEHSCDI